MRKSVSVLLFLFLVPVAFTADSPFFGKWKINGAKSQVIQAGQRLLIDKTSSGDLRIDPGDGRFMVLHTDGNESPAQFGNANLIFKQLDEKTYEIATRVDGEETETMRAILNGNSLAVKRRGAVTNFKRQSGGPGLTGVWTPSGVTLPERTIEIKPNGSDGLVYSDPQQGFECTAKFDGQNYPIKGKLEVYNITFSFNKTGPRSFDMMQLIGDKVASLDTLTVSEDGKILTRTRVPGSSKVVFDRK